MKCSIAFAPLAVVGALSLTAATGTGTRSLGRWSILRLSGWLAVVSLTFSVASASARKVSSTPRAQAAASGACYAKEKKINGESVIVNCGPATAELTYGGRTYAFKDGTCSKAGKTLEIDLGTSLVASSKNNGGFTYISISLLSSKIPAQIDAYQGKLAVQGSAKFGAIALKGKFSGTAGSFAGVSTGKTKPFSGSWNCGGVATTI
jgi:hypothetical protein